jgi:hypothetical protein
VSDLVLHDAYAVIRQAIVNRQQLACFYNGYHRECCPHAIGTTNGISRVLVYQFAGDSSRGLPLGGEWRCMDIPGMSRIEVRDGPWFTGMRHTQRQTCVTHQSGIKTTFLLYQSAGGAMTAG